jgi:DNA-3-methyladenine glycosylase II
MDQWDGQVYRRVLVVKGKPIAVAVTQTAAPAASQLSVEVTGPRLPSETRLLVAGALERLLGLQVDLTDFYTLAAGDPNLASMAERFRGLKPPRFPTMFETLVNAIACQQVTLTLGIRLLNSLADTCGPMVDTDHGPVHACPQPGAIAQLGLDVPRRLGFSYQKAQALIMLADAITKEALDLDGLEAMDDEAALAVLCKLHGVGRWTAEYALLRGMGRLHVFPGDDVGARNNLCRWLNLPQVLDYEGVRRVSLQWAPYGGMIYFHLLLDRLAMKQ